MEDDGKGQRRCAADVAFEGGHASDSEILVGTL